MLAVDDRIQVPLRELTFRYSRSSGPGGQHVNKTSTKATLRFDVNVTTRQHDGEQQEKGARVREQPQVKRRICHDGLLRGERR